MKNIFKVWVIVLVLVAVGLVQSESYSPSEIPSLINGILSNCSNYDCYGVEWGLVIDIYNPSGNGGPVNIYNFNENQMFTPASNTKLFTTSSIFYTFGEDYTIETPFYTQELFVPGVELDHICVKGLGDPSITTQQLANAAQFFSKAASVGSLILDTSFYVDDNFNIPTTWMFEDLTSTYGALPTPLIINENTINIILTPSPNLGQAPTVSFQNPGEETYLTYVNNAVTTDESSNNTISLSFRMTSGVVYINGNLPYRVDGEYIFQIPILDPDQYFFTVFGAMLKEQGLYVNEYAYGLCNTTENRSYVTISPPLSEMLNYTLLNSDNLYAETFLRLLGSNNYNSYPEGTQTWLKGLYSIVEILNINTDYFDQADGSGLSRINYFTPQAFIELIESIYFNAGDPDHDYLSYLPVGGVSGTLSDRFIGTPAQGVVHAKTGSMMGVNSLSGLISQNLQDPPANQPIIFFSILQNNGQKITDGHLIPVIDEIVVLLSQIQF
ncbi:putative peptidase S13 [Tieghemostelium lacteum]|uniref:Putative peptidase S13 n=1 Tax=Tieghemostelium lacteum TaxID=361077 RepID=A0A151Z528_TIELA|nr:putative peptidase S13 [Tieghemostelium lacteum]|eukprot:KYQ89079.1 putative peptidase S13 [Tieghemostelium lacteum]